MSTIDTARSGAATTGAVEDARAPKLGGNTASRKVKDQLARIIMWGCFCLALIPLVWILGSAVLKGGHMLLNLDWWTHSQLGITNRKVGGGAAHAIQGSLIIVGITAVISVPIGVMTAVYLVEYGRGRLARAISFMVDILTGVPSIVAALFVYALWVTTLGFERCGFAASLALMLLMIPTIVRSTEEMLKLVPNELREASYALGVPKWKTIFKIVLPTAFSGIVTGILLGIARVMGETAPLLILLPYTKRMAHNPFSGNMATLPTMINQDRTEALSAAVDRVWGASVTLIAIILVLNLLGRYVARFSKVRN